MRRIKKKERRENVQRAKFRKQRAFFFFFWILILLLKYSSGLKETTINVSKKLFRIEWVILRGPAK